MSGHIVLKYRHGTTYSGTKWTVIKSAIQKNIRRGNLEQALLVTADVMLLKKYVEEGDDENLTVGKSFLTNFLNRLTAISVEDVGIANPYAPCVLKHMSKKGDWFVITSYLCNSKKTRFLSHLKSVYILPPYYWKTEDEKINLLGFHTLLLESYPELKPRDTKVEPLDGILNCLKKKDVHAFFHLSRYFFSTDLSYKSELVERLSMIYVKDKELRDNITVLLNLYKTMKHQEKYLYLYQAMMIILKRDDLHKEDVLLETDNYQTYIERIKDGEVPETPDYILDRHTGADAKDKSLKFFSKEGAKINNEDLSVGIPLYKAVYNTMKDYLDSKEIWNKERIKDKVKDHLCPLETELFELVSRAQLVTASHKADVYFAKMLKKWSKWNKGDKVVVKGPFKDKFGPSHSKVVNKIKKILGLPHVEKIARAKIVPDRWPGSEGFLGLRYVSEREASYFLIADDIISLDIYPVVEKKSKCWEPTPVVNFESEELESYRWHLKQKWASLEDKMGCCKTYILRYMLGIGDMADRNFLLINGKVYSIDEDTSKSSFQTIREFLPGYSGDVISEWLDEEKSSELIKFISEVNSLKNISPAKVQNPSNGQTLDSLKNLFGRCEESE